MPATPRFTIADLAEMPDDGQRHELVRGELLVTPAPGALHQVLVARLFAALLDHLRPNGFADQLLMAPADITLGPDTLVQPDLFIADTARTLRTGKWADITRLFLVVEVISPATARFDRLLKRSAYLRFGVPEYWLVDGEQRQVEIWTPGRTVPVIARDRVVWRHPAASTPCVILLEELFAFG